MSVGGTGPKKSIEIQIFTGEKRPTSRKNRDKSHTTDSKTGGHFEGKSPTKYKINVALWEH
jgi:hypothetical protein